MKSRNPSLLSNSAPPRLADALPNRPNRISSQPPSWGREAATRRHGHLFAAALGAHLASKIFHGGLEAAASVRDAQRAERHLDRTKHAEHHRCVDVAHVRDPERAALQITNPAAEDDAALLATIVAERARLAALHEHCGHRVRALLGADDVERERVRLRPPAHSVAGGLGEQPQRRAAVEGTSGAKASVAEQCIGRTGPARNALAHDRSPCQHSYVSINIVRREWWSSP